MNNGAFGEQFPYTNFHNLNLDWIIKVVKDFFESYPQAVEDIAKKLDAPTEPGSKGMYLMNNGDGTTSWEDIAITYGDTIINAVNDWLEEHPEATTTVEDGSITPVKLNDELLNAYLKSGNVLHFFPSMERATYTQNIGLVVTPHKKAILMDTGWTDDFPLFKSYFDSLYNAGVFDNIDYIIISHYHFDHIDNLERFIEAYPHENLLVYLPPTIEGHYATRADLVERYNAIIAYLSANNIDYEVINERTRRELDPELVYADFYNTDVESWAFYDARQTPYYNNYSMVTILNIGNTYAMYPGDIQTLAQEHLYNTVDLPNLDLFVYPHHAVQNDDNIQFLEKLNPKNTIVTTSSNRITTAHNASIANYVHPLYVLAYGGVIYAGDKAGGSIVKGRTVYRLGRAENVVKIYVNNEHTDNMWDGSEAHPYRTLDEALMHISTNPGIYNEIVIIPTNTSYGNAFIRDIQAPIVVDTPDATTKATFSWIEIDNCSHVELYYLKFVGTPRSQHNYNYHLGVYRSTVYVSTCEFDGSNRDNTTAILVSHNNDMYIYASTFTNLYPSTGQGNGICAYQYGRATTRGNTYINTDACYRLDALELLIEAEDTISGTTRLIVGSSGLGIPFTITPQAVKATTLGTISGSAYSNPVRYSGQLCIIHGPHLYNILTGEEVNVS